MKKTRRSLFKLDDFSDVLCVLGLIVTLAFGFAYGLMHSFLHLW